MPYTQDWFSQNIPNWTKWLADYKGKPYLHFLEIGCFEGRATVWLLENILTHANTHITTIDAFESGMEVDSPEDIYRQAKINYYKNIAPFEDKVTTVKMRSHEALWSLCNMLSMVEQRPQYDFIYIDGSHRSAEVLEDTILSWRLLKPGGLLVWDDYGLKRYPDPLMNPRTGIDAFLNVFEDKYEIVFIGYQVCIKKL